MKTTVKINLFLLCLYLFPNLQAQVSIGIIEAPAEGALLQLKSIAGAAKGGKNAKEGLLMPRVKLVDHLSLEPIISNASDSEKKEHAGLIVYNLTDTSYLKKGLVVWNGIEWNSIKNKEVSENAGMDVKKILYNNTLPLPNKSVPFHSIETRLEKGINRPHYALPQFKVTDSYKPAAGTTRDYEYYVTQYWQNSSQSGYSNEVNIQKVSNSNYMDFTNSDMSMEERNEVWMYDNTSKEIFHIQLFVMGENSPTATKIYAILVEQF
ncbi:MAG: hypothetical protein LBP72_07905 [Dysgonamonadaceae bacterium]|jgi:hypothetical protein|nr:hypothetical protein [Dysgonamonadaceae bacterium]